MRDGTRGFYETVVRGAVDDIVRDLDSALDLGALAARAVTSLFHFHRIFRGMVDETPLGLSRRLRLERAAYWLSSTDKSVATIAFDSGFDTHEATFGRRDVEICQSVMTSPPEVVANAR